MSIVSGLPPGRRRLIRIPLLAALAVSLASFAFACGGDDATTTSTATTAPTSTKTASTSPTATASATETASSTETATSTETSSPTETTTENPGIDYGSLSGEIRIDGSSTVFPITEAVAEDFASVAPNVQANVAFSGTGGGFEKFCRGETEISDASRPIKDSERQACADANINDIVEVRVATDALAIMVNPANDFASCLTVEQLHNIFADGGATNWNQVDPSFPDEPIDIYAPGTDSGTFDYFVETIVTKDDENAAHVSDPSRVTFSEDDNVLALGIEGDESAIGYFGLAYLTEAGQKLKAVEVDGGSGCVAPSEETALDGSYSPLSRPLFIYTREQFLKDRPEVLGFINYYLSQVPTLVAEVGYAPIPADLLAEQVAKIAPYMQP